MCDEASYELRVHGTRLELDAKALDLLGYLIRRPGQLVRKDELFEAVWPDSTVADNALAVAVSKLRKAFAGTPSQAGKAPSIENVYGRGYRLMCSEVRVSSALSADVPKAQLASVAAEGPLVGRSEALQRLHKARQLAQSGRG